jgi:hypothetical protein
MAISCRKDYGPAFGIGDLAVLEEPFNKPYASVSIANMPYYNIPVNSEGINMLTNKMNGEFTIS